jgi:hypothetical protein
MGWTWAGATNKERADSVRAHAKMDMGRVCPNCMRPIGPGRRPRYMTEADLLELFDLTHDELQDVLSGADYPDRSDRRGIATGPQQ